MRVRCYDSDVLRSDFIGECELSLPLEQLETAMNKEEDWRWPAKEILTDDELSWFPLRIDKHTMNPEDLDQPLKQVVPLELQRLARY